MECGVMREGFTVILLFTFTPWSLQASSSDKRDLYINSTMRTWEDASRSCSLVGSDRSPSYYDVNAQEILVLGSNYRGGRPQEGTLYWIGATASFTPWFELLGCQVFAKFKTVKTLTNRSLSIGPVADCYLQCGGHFGVNATHCYCSSKIDKGKLNRSSCQLRTSVNFKSDLIGINNFDDYYQLAMYRVLNRTIYLQDTLDECVINKTTGGLITHPCDAADSSGKNWTDSVLGGLPLNKSRPEQWTNYKRRRLIRWSTGNGNRSYGMACVSVMQIKSTYETVVRPCNKTNVFICQRKTDSGSTGITANVGGITTTTVTTRNLTATHSMLPNPANDSFAGRNVLLVVIGSVAGGGVFVIVAAIIIIRLRRRASFKQQSVSAAMENVYYSGLANEQTPLQVITPSSADDRMTDKTSPDSTERDQLAQRDEDGVYNHTWDKPITEQQTDHVYSSTHTGNEFDCVNSDVYNHTWDKPITEEITDHVYSSTSSGNDANVYDHTNSRNLNSSELNGDNYGVNPK